MDDVTKGIVWTPGLSLPMHPDMRANLQKVMDWSNDLAKDEVLDAKIGEMFEGATWDDVIEEDDAND